MACRSRPPEAGGSLTVEVHGRVGSRPDNAGTVRHRQTGRVRQARREGVREEPALTSRKQRAGSNLTDRGRFAVRASRKSREATLGPVEIAGWEAMSNGCGVGVARLPGSSWAPNLSIGQTVNVGTVFGSPFLLPSQGGSGQTHRRLTARRRGGASVVVPSVGKPRTWRREAARPQLWTGMPGGRL